MGIGACSVHRRTGLEDEGTGKSLVSGGPDAPPATRPQLSQSRVGEQAGTPHPSIHIRVWEL